MDCEYYNYCLNNDKCYRCANCSLLKVKKREKKLRQISPKKSSTPWRRIEHKVAEVLSKYDESAKLQPGSGNRWFAPGDVISENFIVECKSHVVSSKGEKQHTITREQLKKLEDEAAMTGRIPVYAFQFKGDSKVYLVLEMSVFEELLAAVQRGI